MCVDTAEEKLVKLNTYLDVLLEYRDVILSDT